MEVEVEVELKQELETKLQRRHLFIDDLGSHIERK